MDAGGVIPDVASVARNPALAGFNCLVAYATRKLGAAWSGGVRCLVQCRA